MNQQIRNCKSSIDNASDSVKGEECDIYTAQIHRLYDKMLVEEQYRKDAETNPIEKIELTYKSCKYKYKCRQQV